MTDSPFIVRRKWRCNDCHDFGVIEQPDAENGPEHSSFSYCSCSAGQRRAQEDEEQWERRTHARNI